MKIKHFPEKSMDQKIKFEIFLKQAGLETQHTRTCRMKQKFIAINAYFKKKEKYQARTLQAN